MRWLKALVIGMGVAIVIGLTVVILEVAQRANRPSQTTASPAPPVIGATGTVVMTAPQKKFDDSTIMVPIGAVTEDIVSDQGRLIVRLRLTDGRTALLLIDASTGTMLGRITLENRAKEPK